jgi:type IV secretion system protein VirB10
MGVLAGNVAGHAGMGAGIGAAAGAVVGMVGVLLSRGPDAVLAKGSTLEMVLDRPVSFEESELNFTGYQAPRRAGVPSAPGGETGTIPLPPKRWPF